MLDTSLSSAYFSPKLSSKNIQSKNESDCINFPFSHLHVIKVLAVKNRIINLSINFVNNSNIINNVDNFIDKSMEIINNFFIDKTKKF